MLLDSTANCAQLVKANDDCSTEAPRKNSVKPAIARYGIKINAVDYGKTSGRELRWALTRSPLLAAVNREHFSSADSIHINIIRAQVRPFCVKEFRARLLNAVASALMAVQRTAKTLGTEIRQSLGENCASRQSAQSTPGRQSGRSEFVSSLPKES